MKNRLLAAFVTLITLSCTNNVNTPQPNLNKYQYPEGIVLKNENMKAIFSKENGALLCVENLQTGWKVQNRPELGLSFKLMVPTKQKRTNYVLGQSQKLSSVNISDDNKSINFYWNNLKSEDGQVLDIELTGVVSIDEDGLLFDMRIINNSDLVVEAASYPAIGDLSQPEKSEKLLGYRFAYGGMNITNILPYFHNWKGYYGVDYPTQVPKTPDAPFTLLATENEGLYIGNHDTSNKEMVSFMLELKPGFGIAHSQNWGAIIEKDSISSEIPRLELNTWHFSFVNPGEEYTTSSVKLATYDGSWHKGADIYKNWRHTWYKKPPSTKWAEEVHSWQQIQINSSEDNLLFPYKDLVKYAQQCKKYGVKAIQLTGWTKGGQDRDNPSHDIDPRLGTWQDLKDAIEECEKMGVHIILFNKYTWADQSSEWFDDELIKYSIKNMYGDYHIHSGYQYHSPTQLLDINTRRFVPMCPLSEKWRDIANNEFKKSIELGASGMLYDENQHHGGAIYCFDASHGHKVPAHVYQGDENLAEGFREITNKLKPDYLFAGEGCYDLEYRHYNVSYFRINALSHVPGQRYVDSDKAMMVAVVGFEAYLQVNAALRYKYIISYEPYNFKGELDDFPVTIEYGTKVDDLRRKYKEYLWEGEYLDVLEAKVTKDGEPYTDYSVFKTKGKGLRAVVIVNNDVEKEITVDVDLDDSDMSLLTATPENPELVKYNGSVKIPPQGVIVVFERP